MLYTRKIDPIFSDIQNRIFDLTVAALNMMNFEWSYIFFPITNQPSFLCLLHFSWRYSRNKIDSLGHFEESYLRFIARNFNFEIWAEITLVST